MDGFEVLGSQARCAIPALARFNQMNPGDPFVLHALAFCGADATPFLWYSLTNGHNVIAPGQAALAIMAAVDLDKLPLSNALVFVPTLTRLLESTNPYVKNKAGLALDSIRQKSAGGSIGTNNHPPD